MPRHFTFYSHKPRLTTPLPTAPGGIGNILQRNVIYYPGTPITPGIRDVVGEQTHEPNTAQSKFVADDPTFVNSNEFKTASSFIGNGTTEEADKQIEERLQNPIISADLLNSIGDVSNNSTHSRNDTTSTTSEISMESSGRSSPAEEQHYQEQRTENSTKRKRNNDMGPVKKQRKKGISKRFDLSAFSIK